MDAIAEEPHLPHQAQVQPFIRWTGGKRWFAAEHAELLKMPNKRLVEPFLGAGSVFFHLRPHDALLGDINSELINTYLAIREGPETIAVELAELVARHSKASYLTARKTVSGTTASRAARFLYLNQVAFNGLYRVNAKGEFNVPMGDRRPRELGIDYLKTVARCLQSTEILHSDFEPLIARADHGDLVYLDPPYTVKHNQNGFLRYNENLFSWADQERLAKASLSAHKRGARIVMTNAYHDSVQDLYSSEHFEKRPLWRTSSMSAASRYRGRQQELLITSRSGE